MSIHDNLRSARCHAERESLLSYEISLATLCSYLSRTTNEGFLPDDYASEIAGRLLRFIQRDARIAGARSLPRLNDLIIPTPKKWYENLDRSALKAILDGQEVMRQAGSIVLNKRHVVELRLGVQVPASLFVKPGTVGVNSDAVLPVKQPKRRKSELRKLVEKTFYAMQAKGERTQYLDVIKNLEAFDNPNDIKRTVQEIIYESKTVHWVDPREKDRTTSFKKISDWCSKIRKQQ